MMSLDSFAAIDAPGDMAKVFGASEYAKCKSFRASEDSRYVGLCLPHVLMRLPYGTDGGQVDAFNYEEGVDANDHSNYLWRNSPSALARELLQASRKCGAFPAIA